MKKDVKKPIKDGPKSSSQTEKLVNTTKKNSNVHQDLDEDLTMNEEEEALKKPAPNEEL